MTVKREGGGTWCVDFYVNGRGSKRVRRGGFASKAHAQRFERDYHDTPAPTKGRLLELVELWFDVHGCTLKSGKRRLALLRQTSERLGNPFVTEVTPTSWAHYRVERIKTVIPSTLNIEQICLSSVFEVLIRQGLYQGVNPLIRIPLYKIEQNSLTYLTFEQIDLLFAELRKSHNPYVMVIVRLALSTGARWSEVQNLRRSQLLPDRVVFSNTKSARLRTVPVSPELIKEALSVALPTDRLFGPARGAYEEAYKRCGFKTPGQLTHMLRHTFASQFVIAGGDLRTLRDILGHSDISTTMRYSHLAPEHLDKALALNPLSLAAGRSQSVDKP